MAYINRNKIPSILRKGDKGDNAFIRYSANADGTDFTEERSEGQTYVGFATGQIPPTDKSGYIWVELKGECGADGTTPHIGDNGNWFIGETDTGIRAEALAEGATVVQTAGDSEHNVMSQKSTSDYVSQIAKNADISAELCGNIFPLSPSAWEQGAILNDGSEGYESRRIRTDYINTKGITNLHFKTNAEKTVRISVVYYTLTDGVYTRVTESGWKTEDTDFDVTNFDAIRISGAKLDNTALTPFDVVTLYSGASMTKEKVIDKDDIRIMQYNIGRYNYGLSGGLADDKIPVKLENYKKFFGEYRPDIVCLQEYERYIDASETVSADDVLFGELFPYLPQSHYPAIFRSSIPYARYDSDMLGNDDTSTRTRYTLAIFNIKHKKVAVLTTALYYNNATRRAIQFNEAMQILSKYDFAIFAGDMNYASQEEMDSLLQIASDNGFKACNGGYFGTFDTLDTVTYFKPIDNILVKGDVIIRNVFAPDVYDKLSSDHYPIIADIHIK